MGTRRWKTLFDRTGPLAHALRRARHHHREAAWMYRELARREKRRELRRDMLLGLAAHHERHAAKVTRRLVRFGLEGPETRSLRPLRRLSSRLWRRAMVWGGLRCVGWWAERVERRDAIMLLEMIQAMPDDVPAGRGGWRL